MEYIIRQKIYDSRFWKEECFGLTAADVMERSTEYLTCIGGTFSGMGKPTKFLSLTLKLLQLQPDISVIQTFLEQNHFKYLRALGAFYLRMTGRPQDIYEMLEPLYADYSKLKYRGVNEWKLIHVDEFIDELLTKSIVCGIAMPRLPIRETLEEAGYLEEGPRMTALHDALIRAGGVKEYLKIKVDEEVREKVGCSTNEDELADSLGAIALWERRYGTVKTKKRKDGAGGTVPISETATTAVVNEGKKGKEIDRDTNKASVDGLSNCIAKDSEDTSRKRKSAADDSFTTKKKKSKEKKEKKKKYGTLFKASAVDPSTVNNHQTSPNEQPAELESERKKPVDENSDEYWNSLRSSLGMSLLKK
eukprot:CAMPEP_0197195212 /NCGR_PEP_ID=MMETSP1423-20130617/30657_1 /TAXON_ID=476441 /ORGANISM="Pseudo-nitzschia heimii, Strain UNC1101" /LENGTH=361 /DNA_ID=CAMNT_0042648787 /DNA_START=126 /DNA_END=1211 /DNA_ORIENTATION=+